MSAALRVGIIGCGNIAARMHLPAWQELAGEIEVVALCDPNAAAVERLRIAAGLSDADTYLDPSGLLARTDIDIVDVCSPQSARRDVLVRAAEAGKHILCEKPLATTPADAAAAVAAADANDVLLAIVHNYLSLPEVVAAQEAIAAGEIGTVQSVMVNMLGVVYEAGAAGDWRMDPARSGGGVLMDLLHGVYLAEALVGEPFRRASAYLHSAGPASQVEDLGTCRFETDHRVALVNIGWGLGPGGIHIAGTGGRIDIRYGEGATPPWANLEHVRVTTANGTREVLGADTEQRVGLGNFPSHKSAFKLLVRSFVDAVAGRGAPTASGADGLRALESAIGAYVSAATGQTVTIPLDRDSPPFLRGALGVADIEQVGWSPLVGTQLFRTDATGLSS